MWSTFMQGLKLITVTTGDVLYASGAQHHFVYMVDAGLFKAEILDNDRPTTAFFAEEGDIMAPLAAFGIPEALAPSAGELFPRSSSLRDVIKLDNWYTVSALERSRVMRADANVLLALAQEHSAWATLAFRIAIMRAMVLQADNHWLRQSPEQRYMALVERNPSLVARVSQRELAMYLNVTPTSLSRIVRRVRTGPAEPA